MSLVSKVLAENTNKDAVRGIPNRRLNQPVVKSRYTEPLGIEIELEGRNLPNAGYMEGVKAASGSSWDVKTDRSLRNGFEYVLTKPCNEDEVEGLITGLFGVFEKRDTRLIPSNRCSIHVHYNAVGLRVNSITSMIALWTVLEEPLIRWWGDARYKNHFCLSTKDEESTLQAWNNFLQTGDLPEGDNLKYSALNLLTLQTYGSLECRVGGAVTNPVQAITWTRFLYRMFKYAELHYLNPQQIAYDISERRPCAILEDICGTEFSGFMEQVLEACPDFNETCMESFHNIQPMLFDYPWPQWEAEINKPYVPDPFSKKPSAKKENNMPGFVTHTLTVDPALDFNNAEWVITPVNQPQVIRNPHRRG
jgi:hypothetical protein